MQGTRELDRVQGLEGSLREDDTVLIGEGAVLGREEEQLLLVRAVDAELPECLLDVVDVLDELEGACLCAVAARQVLVSHLVIPFELSERFWSDLPRSDQAAERLDLAVFPRDQLDEFDRKHRDVEHAKVLPLGLLEAQDGPRCLLVLLLSLQRLLLLLLLLVVEELVELLDEADEVVTDVAGVLARRRRLDRRRALLLGAHGCRSWRASLSFLGQAAHILNEERREAAHEAAGGACRGRLRWRLARFLWLHGLWAFVLDVEPILGVGELQPVGLPPRSDLVDRHNLCVDWHDEGLADVGM